MPLLDVTEILTDPLFAEKVTVERRAITMGDNGRQVFTTTTFNPIAVVTSAATQDLERTAVGEWRGHQISVITKFRLRGPSPGFQPDVVVWNGDPHVVIQIDDYTHYGPGFVEAICESMSGTDQPPV